MTNTLSRIFSEGFRIFFLAAGLIAAVAVLVWIAWLEGMTGGVGPIAPNIEPQQWHAHELIFGYGSAALAGFLLTAVPNWTGARAAPQRFLVPTAGLWLAGRGAIWFSGLLPPLVVAGIDLLFPPLLAANIAIQLIKRPKPQNMVFLAFLTLFWLSNLLVHLEWAGVTAATLNQGLQGGILSLCAMIAVLGGRVTPAFTRNAMRRAGVAEDALPRGGNLTDRAAPALCALTAVVTILGLPAGICGTIAMAAGLAVLARLVGWRGRWTWGQPILWSLHAAYGVLGLGQVLWGASLLGLGDQVAALHVLGIGAVGGMTLAVMSRAVLGHSGRALIAPRPVALAYGLIFAAALLRWAGAYLPGSVYLPVLMVSGGFWILGFVLYLTSLWPALTGPRAGADA